MGEAHGVAAEEFHLGPTDVVVLGRYPKPKQQALLRRLHAVSSPTPFHLQSSVCQLPSRDL